MKVHKWIQRELAAEYSIVSEDAYVARAAVACWKCDARIAVFCIYCGKGEINEELFDEFAVSNITAVDRSLREQLTSWPSLRFGFSDFDGGRYLANHCPKCGAIQSDYFLHCEPEGAFFRVKAAPAGTIGLTRLVGRVRLSGDEGFEP